METREKIISFNVRVWTRDRDKSSPWYWKDRMSRIRSMIEREAPAVLCLQELSFPACCFIPKEYRRVGLTASHPIYVRRGIKTRRHRFHFRWDSCEALLMGSWVQIINVHLHWDNEIFLRNMDAINKAIEDEYYEAGIDTIATGDFNNSYETVRKAMDVMQVVVKNSEWTFKNSTSGNEAVIDHFAIPDMECSFAVLASDQVMSDHRPIRIEFDKLP